MGVSAVNQRYRIEESGLYRLRFHLGDSPRSSAAWRINGYPARLLIWSPEEWEHLETRPIDAQYHPFGVWCALRMD